VTKSFHEFVFDLQTDPAGNFYFAKAGPVKNGGRDVTALKKHPGMSFGDLAREAISAACTTPA